MAVGAYNAVKVSDLEVATVLARELGSVPGRPSLTLSQLQMVFGADHLDTAERERIEAALQAAGLHAEPSVLDAHPDERLLFGAENGARRRFARAKPATEPAVAATKSLPITAILAGVALAVVLSLIAGWPVGLAFLLGLSLPAAPRRAARPSGTGRRRTATPGEAGTRPRAGR